MAPTTSKTPDEAALQITRDNRHWGSTLGVAAGPITYGFRASAPPYDDASHDIQVTFTPFASYQIDAAVQAVQLWQDVANVSLKRVGSGDAGSDAYTNNATILLANYDNPSDGAGAFAYYPGSTAANKSAGDLWNNVSDDSTHGPPYARGGYDFLTLLHELGHTLGLEHPGTYNAAPGVTITYDQDALYVEDTRQYTVMSYFGAWNEIGGIWSFNVVKSLPNVAARVYPSTPMVDDVTAIQRLYGANFGTRSGATTYFGPNDNSGFNLPDGGTLAMTIWDGGGVDTIDASNQTAAVRIDLQPGHYSSIGALSNNIGVAAAVVRDGVVADLIENANGGAGADTIIGNQADNVLVGNGGDDTLEGDAGNDTLFGGDGNDTAMFQGPFASYRIRQNADGSIRVASLQSDAPDGTDTLYSIEMAVFGTSGSLVLADLVQPDATPVIVSNGGADLAILSLAAGLGGAVATVAASDADGDALTYAIVGGADQAAFRIDASTGVLSFKTKPEVANPADANGDNVYIVVVEASDGILADDQTLEFSLIEGSPAGPKYFYSGVTDQAYAAYEEDLDPSGRLVRLAFSGVSGQAYSSYEYDYDSGQLAGSKYFFSDVGDQPYAGYEVDLDASGRLARVVVADVTGEAYSSFEYDYAGGALSGSRYFFIGISGQAYTDYEVDLDSSNLLSRVSFAGISGQAYSSYDNDYVAGDFVGSRYFFSDVTGQAYTGYEVDLDTKGQLVRFAFSGVQGQAYSSYDYDYDAGVLTGSRYFFSKVLDQAYASYETDLDAQGAVATQIYNNNDGSHRIIGFQDDLVIHAMFNDLTTGGGAHETFVYGAHFGQSAVTDFASHLSGPEHDVFVLPADQFADFASVLDSTQTIGGNAVITAASGDRLTLVGVTKDVLATLAANFSFA